MPRGSLSAFFKYCMAEIKDLWQTRVWITLGHTRLLNLEGLPIQSSWSWTDSPKGLIVQTVPDVSACWASLKSLIAPWWSMWSFGTSAKRERPRLYVKRLAKEYFCKNRSQSLEIFSALGHRMKKPSWYRAEMAVLIARVPITCRHPKLFNIKWGIKKISATATKHFCTLERCSKGLKEEKVPLLKHSGNCLKQWISLTFSSPLAAQVFQKKHEVRACTAFVPCTHWAGWLLRPV